MASPDSDGFSTFSQHLDTEKNNLRKSLEMLAVKQKDVNEYLNSSKICFDETIADLESKEKSLYKNTKELDLVRESLKIQLEELECDKENFRNFQQKQIEEFEMKDVQLGVIQRRIDERLKEVEIKEKGLSERRKSIEALLGKIEMEKLEFMGIQKTVAENLNTIILKEQSLGNWSKELDEREIELCTREKQVDAREEQLEVNEKRNEERVLELHVKLQELDVAQKVFDGKVVKNLYDECDENFDLRRRELDSREKQVCVREEKLIISQKSNDERAKELNIKEQVLDSAQWINEQEEELNIKEQVLDSAQWINEQEEDLNIKEQVLDSAQWINEQEEELRLREKKNSENNSLTERIAQRGKKVSKGKKKEGSRKAKGGS